MINGKISNINAGEFNNDKKRVKLVGTSIILKKSNSVKRFNKNTKLKIVENTKKNDLKKIKDINLT
tara:strand:- start:128 stop:325 length:198 start_codon:yes stop_codon:yes gene_type:complete